MFDLAWGEIAVIGLVAVLVLGPKELPQAMRTMAKVMRKMRSLTSELQGHMNEIVREAELEDVRNSIQKLSTTNLKAEVAKLADPTGELASELNKPLLPQGSAMLPAPEGEMTGAPRALDARDSNDGGLPPPAEFAPQAAAQVAASAAVPEPGQPANPTAAAT